MPELSDKTKKTYESCLRSVLVDKTTHTVRFVPPDLHEKVEDVIAHLKEAHPSPNSQRVYLSAIMWKVSEDPPVWLKYKEYFDKLRVSADAQATSQSISEAKSENYLPWERIEEARVSAWMDNISSPRKLSNEDYLMMCLYTLIPPVRNDYAEMVVCFGFEKIPPIPGNYLLLWDIPNLGLDVGVKMKFVFGDYKTFKTYGVKEFMIDDDKVKTALIKHLNERTIKVKERNAPQSQYQTCMTLFNTTKDAFAKKLQSIFERYAGKPVGIDLLRRAYITKFIEDENPSIARKKEIAERMLHSYVVQEIYRIVDSDEEV
jgi:hypothetical protein